MKWYDTRSEEEKEEIRARLTQSTNSPEDTHAFLTTMLTHAAVFTPRGEYRRLHSHSRDNEHTALRTALARTRAKQTLEVGLAYGTSALVFAEYHQRHPHQGIVHTIIDPVQFGSDWEGIGVENLKRVGFRNRRDYRLLQESSVLALPRLQMKFGEGWLDVAFIDGWHTFDYTLVDVFYCLAMLRVGGILVVDDKRMKSVRAVATYVQRAYPHCVDICPTCPTIFMCKKISHDMRAWNADESISFAFQ